MQTDYLAPIFSTPILKGFVPTFSHQLRVQVSQFANSNLALEEMIHMPPKRKKPNANQWGIEFINFPIPERLREDCIAWTDSNAPKLNDMMQTLLEGGHKLSVSPDFINECFIVAVTGTEDSVDNAGKCFTARADNVTEALLIACYKHFMLADDGVWPDSKQKESWG